MSDDSTEVAVARDRYAAAVHKPIDHRLIVVFIGGPTSGRKEVKM